MRVLPRAVHVVALALAALAPSCVIGGIEIEGRRCPCVDDWVCDVATDRCVRSGIDAGVASDGGERIDAGVADAELADAEIADTGPADAGPPPPFCETVPEALFCEDFEGDADWRGRWVRVDVVDGGSIQASPLAGRSGVGLRVLAPASSQQAMLTAALDTAAPSTLYFRAFVRVAASNGPIDLFVLSADGAEGSVSARLIPDTTSFAVQVIDATGAQASQGLGRAWRTGEWFCVSAVVERGPLGWVRVDAPGPRAAVLDEVDSDLGTPYDAFSIAIDAAGGELELDDVSWTRAALACP